MKTTLRYAAFAFFSALCTLPTQIYANATVEYAKTIATARKAASTTYMVKFIANGGKGKMSTQKFTVNKSSRLPSNRFTRKGYVFIGWSTSKTGTVTYQNGQSVYNLARGGKTITLYAQWAVQSYLVAFFANGGSGSMPLQKHTYGKAAKLTANRFTRKGYSFAGWATKSTGALKFRNKASVKNLTKAGRTIKLYARWKVSPASNAKPASTTAPSGSDDAVDFSQLHWDYGGFNGSYAKKVEEARISDLGASKNGLSYKWASGGCQNLGATSATDASCVACLFCYSGGKWTGGKFDWISTKDLSPSFKNIVDQYKGWSESVLASAEKYAFVILKKDASARTNVIRVKSPGYSSASSSSVKPSTSGDEVDFSLLQWTYGGFRGGSAKLSAQPRISGLKVSSNGMSYAWKSGGCENLGATSGSDYSHTVACLFCYYGGKWVGGKFDWISTSRRTRDFENIKSKYNGWSPTVFAKAEAYAFVIVSKDGKTRSNVIRCGK